MTLTFKMSGFDALAVKLAEVKSDLRHRGGRAALRKAAQVVRNTARENAARIDDAATPESIEKNIVERWNPKVFKQTGNLGFRVGVLGGARKPIDDKAAAKAERRRKRLGQTALEDLGELRGQGAGNPGGDTWYWRFLEFGTSHAAPRPFMRPAIQSSISAAVNTFVSEYDKSLERAIRRARKSTT